MGYGNKTSMLRKLAVLIHMCPVRAATYSDVSLPNVYLVTFHVLSSSANTAIAISTYSMVAYTQKRAWDSQQVSITVC